MWVYFLLPEELSALSGNRLLVPGPGLPASVDRVDALPVDLIRSIKSTTYRDTDSVHAVASSQTSEE